MLRKSIISPLPVSRFAAPHSPKPPGTQTPGLKRIPLQKIDVPPGEREAVTAIAEIAPNTDVARHTHPGPEVDYVLEGEITLMVAGQPERTFKAGDSFNVLAETPHAARSGANGVKVLATYIVEKGKPLASPAPLAGK